MTKNPPNQSAENHEATEGKDGGDFFAFGVGNMRRPMAYKCHHSNCGAEAESPGRCPVEGHGELSPVF